MADLGVSTQYRVTLSPAEFRLIMKALRVVAALPRDVVTLVPSPPTSDAQKEMAELQDALFKSQQSQLKGFAAHAAHIAKEDS